MFHASLAKWGLRGMTTAIVVATLVFAAAAQPARTIQGELVALKGSSNRFRLVDHAGSFSAEPSTIQRLDGKPVEVDLGADGKVLAIREVSIEIAPIEVGMDVVAGRLQVVDAASRRFKLVGQDKEYTAPARVALESLSGLLVEVLIDDAGKVRSVAATGGSAAVIEPTPAGPAPCRLADALLVDGSTICRGGKIESCRNGVWEPSTTPCTE